MKYLKLCTGVALSLLLFTTTNSQAVPHSGKDNRVEWTMQQNWPITGNTVDMVHSLDGKLVYILNDKQMVQVFTAQGQLQGSIPVGPGVSAIDIAPQGEKLYLIDDQNKSFTSLAVSFIVDIDISGSPFKGPANAPVTIALFTDFECPYCSKIVPLLDQLLENNPTTVKLVFKNMPLKMHRMAVPAHKAALAAREQGKFWEFHDKLFAEKKLTQENFDRIAGELQLDIPKFKADMASPAIQSYISKDLLDANKAGVTGTPTAFINGRKAQQRTLAGFQAIIDDELGKQQSK